MTSLSGPPGLRHFQDLMRYRIMDILLVATPYDAFMLEEAGELQERVLGEFRNLDLHYAPGLTAVENVSLPLELDGVAAKRAPPSADVVARVAVKDRDAAERELASLIARVDGRQTQRRREHHGRSQQVPQESHEPRIQLVRQLLHERVEQDEDEARGGHPQHAAHDRSGSGEHFDFRLDCCTGVLQ